MVTRIPLTQRFESYVVRADDPDACWSWTGSRHRHGYGTIGEGGRNGRDFLAHRLSYEIHVGPIPPGMVICHRCDNPICTNPAHLFVGTQADNVRDMDAKGRRVAAGQIGTAHHQAKLSDAQVIEIRRRADAGECKAHLAVEFGVTKTTTTRIANRRTWKHLK